MATVILSNLYFVVPESDISNLLAFPDYCYSTLLEAIRNARYLTDQRDTYRVYSFLCVEHVITENRKKLEK